MALTNLLLLSLLAIAGFHAYEEWEIRKARWAVVFAQLHQADAEHEAAWSDKRLDFGVLSAVSKAREAAKARLRR